MQVLPNVHPKTRPELHAQILDRGLTDAPNGTESTQERACALWADPGNVEQLRGEGLLAAPPPLSGHCESMGLVTRLTQHLVGRIVLVRANGS
jgi:hypothetical protein